MTSPPKKKFKTDESSSQSTDDVPLSLLEPCYICKMTEEDDILYGPFMTKDGIRCHYFCLLFFFDLMPRGCDVRDMVGFRVSDIKTEVKKLRKRKLKCHYCQKSQASMVCCEKSCRKRFHLPCAMKHDCLMQFFGAFESFCDIHAAQKIRHPELPAPNQLCAICFEALGPYSPVRCFQPQCCLAKVKEKEKGKSYWMHYRCVMVGARHLGYYFNCFSYCCALKTDEAKQGYLDAGIFIPKRDALYEAGDHYANLDQPVEGELYLETTYDQDATLLQRTFVESDEMSCNYGNRCISSKLGKTDIGTCAIDGCENFVHVKCVRYYCDYKSNEEARKHSFFCRSCMENSCLSLI